MLLILCTVILKGNIQIAATWLLQTILYLIPKVAAIVTSFMEALVFNETRTKIQTPFRIVANMLLMRPDTRLPRLSHPACCTSKVY